MSATPYSRTVREAVAVFASRADLHEAVDALVHAGFDRAGISLMTSLDTVSAVFGHRIARIDVAEDTTRAFPGAPMWSRKPRPGAG